MDSRRHKKSAVEWWEMSDQTSADVLAIPKVVHKDNAEKALTYQGFAKCCG